MAKIDVSELVAKMSEAAAAKLSDAWPSVADFATEEFRKLGQAVIFVQCQHAEGKMTEQQARLHMQIQKNAARIVLLTIEGLGILAVEAAINAALAVVKETVNTAVGFALL